MPLIPKSPSITIAGLITMGLACTDGSKPSEEPKAEPGEEDAAQGGRGMTADAASGDGSLAHTQIDGSAGELPADGAALGPRGDAASEHRHDGQVLAPDATAMRDAAAGEHSCDPRTVECRKAPPVCPQGQVPEVVDNCFGACVRVDRCVCSEPDDCPAPEQYTCHRTKMRCDYFVN